MTSFTLLFAQWQGSGSPEAPLLRKGAEQIAAHFETEARVDLSSSSSIETRAGIKGREQLLEQLASAAAILEQTKPTHLFTIGGDCGVDLAPASYLNAHHNHLALVWLDAHGDLNTPTSSPSGAFHGMILRTLLGEGDADFLAEAFSSFSPEGVFLAGAREFDPPERAFAERLEHLRAETLERRPTCWRRRSRVEASVSFHIHLDLDVLEPAEFAATGYPTPRGLSIGGLGRLLATLDERFEIVGLTLTELCRKRMTQRTI